MTTAHLEDLTNQLIETLERRGDTSRIVSAIGDALATATLPEVLDWERDDTIFPWEEAEEVHAE
jgi:hypothetical protein